MAFTEISRRATEAIEALNAVGLQIIERSPGVLVSSTPVATIGRTVVNALKSYAESSERRRARILFHESESSLLQEMLIAAAGFTIWPPILNDNAPQSWTVIEGSLAFVRYSPPGEVVDLRVLSAGDEISAFLRFSINDWYTTVPLSDMTVYLEVKRGPYRATRFADWGPQSADDPQAKILLERLRLLGFSPAREMSAYGEARRD